MKNISWIFKKKLEKEIASNAEQCKGEILDIGCGEKPYEKYFKKKGDSYFGIDLPFSPLAQKGTVDAFANALMLPFKKKSFNTILCFEILDDIPEPTIFFSEINRTLKKEGLLFLSVPQMWNVHNAPYDYYRYTKYGLTYQAEKHGFEVLSITGIGGFWARIAAKLFKFLYRFGFNKILLRLIEPLVVIMQPLFYGLDSIFFTKDDVICNLMIAKKIKDYEE